MILFLLGSGGGGGSGGSSLFTPPIRVEIPRIDYMAPAIANRLSSHFTHGWAAVNVYKLLDGSYQENHPGDESLIAFTYFGARTYIVTADEATALTEAGYEIQ